MVETVKIKGLKELSQKMKQLPKELRGKTLNFAVRKGATIIRDEAANRAPERTGVLKRSIVIRKRKVLNASNEAAQAVLVKKNAKSGGDPFYWRFVEFGFKSRGGKHIAANPFMRRAFESRKFAVVEEIKSQLAKKIKRVAGK